MSNLSTFYPAPITAADLGLGAGSNATFGSIQNTPIGNTTPAAGTFTTLTGSTQIVGPQGSTVGSLSSCAISLGAANTGFNISNDQLVAVKQGSNVWYANNSSRFVVASAMSNGLDIEATGAPLTFSARTSLQPEANNVLALRSGTNAQEYRVYNTFTNTTNFERGFMRWSSNVLQIGTEKAGTGSARALELQSDGVTRLTVQTGGTVALSSHLTAENGFIRIASAQAFQWLNRSKVYSLADGNIGLYNAGENGFNLLQFGGITSSFPALKRSSTALQVRLADDSAFAPLEALSFTTANSRIVCDDTNTLVHVGNTPRVTLIGTSASPYIAVGNAADIRWSSTGRSDQASSPTIQLARDADGILAQRAGTTAQTWRLYNTVSGTGNVNFDRVNFRWASNEFIIDAEAGGTGTLRGIKIGSATSSLLGFYGAVPVDRPATVADPTGGGTVDTEARTAINDIIDRLQELGLIA